MSSASETHDREYLELMALYAVHAVPAQDVPAVEAHLAACARCRHELDALRSTVGAFASWPTDVLRPAPSLWDRLAQRVAADSQAAAPASPRSVPTPPPALPRPEWEEAAPGIWYKLLATDAERNRVSMLVRLEPGVAYPPHEHAGIEELYLLDGELMIDDRKLYPGDYNRAEPGSADQRVWSETGCTCVLLTSSRDILH